MTTGDKPTTVNFEHYAAPEVWAEIDELRERNRKLTEAAAFNPPGLDRIVTATERIATTLEQIAAHLAPVTAVHPASDQPPVAAFAAATENPWIDWPGGACPVDGNTPVDIRMRDSELQTAFARDLDWDHEGSARGLIGYWEIVAYRLATQGQTP